MTQASVKRLCLRLMKKHGLTQRGWKFEWMASKVDLADCDCDIKTIRLSSYKPFLRSKCIVRDSVLHEICHALVGCHHNHNKRWKKKAIELGCEPKATFSAE